MAPISTDDLLDLGPAVGGQRAEDFVFELLDDNRGVIGTLDASESNAPQVQFDTSRSTMRTCSGLQISASDLSAIDTRRDRVRPRHVLQNGDKKSLGVFMFGTDARAPFSWGVRWTPDLFDESFLLAQQIGRTVSLPPGSSILSLLVSQLGEVGIDDVVVGVADQASSSPLTWPATALRSDIVNGCAAALGGYPPFLDNDGAFTLKAIPSDGAGPEHVYDQNTHVLDGTTVVTNSNYKAPNVYIVTNGDLNAPVVGVFRLPDAAPNSVVQTGREVTSTTTIQGITAAVANDVAKALAITDTATYTQATFSSTADSRHGGFDIVQLYGSLYIETAWGISCVPGGAMTHALTGIYA